MEDYIVNNAGAKIYSDTSKHEFLKIPKLRSLREKGFVYEVLSIGMLGSQREMVVSIKEDDSVVAYRLPDEFSDWAQDSLFLAKQGLNAFPSKVEFGIVDDQPYVEIL